MKKYTEHIYRGIVCKQVDSKVWKIVIGQSEYLYPTFSDAKCAIDAIHEGCIKGCFSAQVSKGTAGKQKNSQPVLIAIIVFLFFFLISLGSGSNDTPKATKAPAPTVATSTAKPTVAPTNTPAPAAEETVFTVEHDEEYYATQDYIYKFLTEKGYEVQTIIGVPNVGRYEDDTPDDLTVPWYAIVKHNGEWTEFIVLLFNGEVSHIRPNK